VFGNGPWANDIYFLGAGVMECIQVIHVDFAFPGHQCGEPLGNLDRFQLKTYGQVQLPALFLISSLMDSKSTAMAV